MIREKMRGCQCPGLEYVTDIKRSSPCLVGVRRGTHAGLFSACISSTGGGSCWILERMVSGRTMSDSYMAGLFGHCPLCVRVERSLALSVLHVSSLVLRICRRYLRVWALASESTGLPVWGLSKRRGPCSPRRFMNNDKGDGSRRGLSRLFWLMGLCGLRGT
jgi:hypothetical protein